VLEPASIDVAEILHGGPPRDGIPALDHPPHVQPDAAPWQEDEMVLGVVAGDAARAYPVAILVWHELVNDSLGDRPILVSYCPLCGTGLVFDRRIEGRARRFGVSGLLYRSDLLLYDRETESLWSQISFDAVTGPARGQRLTPMRSRMVPWHLWRAEHPDTSVLSLDTGYERRYGKGPYGDYATSERLYFPAPSTGPYHPKTPTLGLRLPNGPARAYPRDELVRAGGVVRERFAGRPVRVAYDPSTQVFEIEAPAEVEVVEGYWFAWSAFHPETSIFQAEDAAADAAANTRIPTPVQEHSR
jgi:hypothetical protein